jgi:hypothetical protein
MPVRRERFGDIPDNRIEHGSIRVPENSGDRRGRDIPRDELRGPGEGNIFVLE